MDSNEEYILMHKNIPVCFMEISINGDLKRIRRISENKDHFPIGGQMNDNKFHEWWCDRAIPKSRHGVKNALQKLGYESTGNILVDNLALSLTDCYWIKPRDKSLKWEDVSLFSNNFVDTFGELTINEESTIDLMDKTRFSLASSQGELQKKWCIDTNDCRYLIKGNYGNSYQQSLNEIFVSDLHKQLNSNNYTQYNMVKIKTSTGNEGIGCMSYSFCNENTEFISAWELLQSGKLKPGSYYYLFKNACLNLGMNEKYFDDYIDYMILTDFLVTNTDRHMNNIGVLRNPDTLELIGLAPLYDSGNSMFYNYSYNELVNIDLMKIKTHSFITWEVDLLNYVKNPLIINPDNINPDFSIYDKDTEEQQIKYPLIKNLFMKKMEILKLYQKYGMVKHIKQYKVH